MKLTPDRKLREDWLIAGMFAAGAVSFTIAFFLQTIEDPFALACLVVLTALCEALSVKLYFDGRVSISFIGTLLSAVLFGPLGGVLAAARASVTRRRRAGQSPVRDRLEHRGAGKQRSDRQRDDQPGEHVSHRAGSR